MADTPARLVQVTEVELLPVIKSVLEAAGIPYFVQGEEASALFPLEGSLPMAAVVHVPSDRLEEARDLLRNAAIPTDSP